MPNVSSAIGQTLFAVKNVDIKRQAYDSSPTVYTAKKGESIGTVQDYLPPNSTRSKGYYVFKDKNGNAYYTVHDNSLYDKQFDVMPSPSKNPTPLSTTQINKKWVLYGGMALLAIVLIIKFFSQKSSRIKA